MKNTKTVCIGDTHGRPFWKEIIEKESPNRVIFLGDYFDSFDYTPREQLQNYDAIITYKEEHPELEMILLIGNHDHHYFAEVGNTGTSGYQGGMAKVYETILSETKQHLQMAYKLVEGKDTFIFSHAGISPVFMDYAFGKDGWTVDNMVDLINELWKHKPRAFIFNGRDGSGDDSGQTPIWIRPRSLMKDGQEIKKEVIQVVGHTQQYEIDIKGKATGGRYLFIDTLGTHKEYLLINNGFIKSRKLEDNG